MSLLIHRAERADHLVHALGVLLSDPLPDPFATEIVSVPTPRVERWLSQRLAARLGTRPGRSDGVCAAVDFCSPGRLVARAVAVTGAAADEDDPWRPDRMVWPLLRVLDESRDRAVGPAAVVPPRTAGGPALVRRPAPGRAVRGVRGEPAGDAAGLVRLPRRRPARPAPRS
jgi:exodeoxyribonuclease V gamma subunit